MKIHIYKIYFPTSERSNPYYVGVTENLEDRMSRHLRSKFLVGLALNKYSDWTIEILHTTKDRDTAKLLEIEEIRHYNCIAPNGYNLTRGGDGVDGYKHTEEAKEKMSRACIGREFSKETRKKLSLLKIGNKSSQGYQNTKGKHWKWPEEAKEKIQGRKCSKVTKRKMQISQLKRRIREFENG